MKRTLFGAVQWGVLSVAVLSVVGCAHTFRNRNFDYLTQPVEQIPAVKIPQGVTKPNFSPNYTLPPGPTVYPKVTGVSMTPPGYAQQYDPKTIAKGGAPAVVPETAAKPAEKTQTKSAQLASLQKQLVSAQSQLSTLQQQAETSKPTVAMALPATAHSTAVAVSSKPPVVVGQVHPGVSAGSSLLALPAHDRNPKAAVNKPVTTASQTVLATVPSTVPADALLTLSADNAVPNAATEKSASQTSPQAVPVATQPAAPLKRLHSRLTSNAAEVYTMTVNASFPVVWAALPKAVLNSGFETLSTDATKGFYYLVPAGASANGNTWMLLVQTQGADTTIMPFGPDGSPANSRLATGLMQYLQQHLAEP